MAPKSLRSLFVRAAGRPQKPSAEGDVCGGKCQCYRRALRNWPVTPIAIAALVVGGLGLEDDAAAGKKRKGKRGKVVRVERGSVTAGGVIRVCQMSGNGSATCYGREPAVGDRGVVVDSATWYGEARIATVTPVPDSCGNLTSYNVTIEASNTQVATLTYGAILLLDYVTNERGRSMPAAGQLPIQAARAGEYAYVAVDQDGDADIDLYISAYTCDSAGNVVAYGQGQIGYCMGYWAGDGTSWRLLRTDVVRSC